MLIETPGRAIIADIVTQSRGDINPLLVPEISFYEFWSIQQVCPKAQRAPVLIYFMYCFIIFPTVTLSYPNQNS